MNLLIKIREKWNLLHFKYFHRLFPAILKIILIQRFQVHINNFNLFFLLENKEI